MFKQFKMIVIYLECIIKIITLQNSCITRCNSHSEPDIIQSTILLIYWTTYITRCHFYSEPDNIHTFYVINFVFKQFKMIVIYLKFSFTIQIKYIIQNEIAYILWCTGRVVSCVYHGRLYIFWKGLNNIWLTPSLTHLMKISLKIHLLNRIVSTKMDCVQK